MTAEKKGSGGTGEGRAKGAGKGKSVQPALSFEEALARLENCARRLASDDITLEDAIGCYEEGVGYYRSCGVILEAAKQKIEIIDPSALAGEDGKEEEGC